MLPSYNNKSWPNLLLALDHYYNDKKYSSEGLFINEKALNAKPSQLLFSLTSLSFLTAIYYYWRWSKTYHNSCSLPWESSSISLGKRERMLDSNKRSRWKSLNRRSNTTTLQRETLLLHGYGQEFQLNWKTLLKHLG